MSLLPNGRPVFCFRKPHDDKEDVTLATDAARLMPDALRHVASTVFEVYDDEDDDRDTVVKNGMLLDAAMAVDAALASSKETTVSVGFTADEAAMIPEALRHVAKNVYRGSPKETLLRDAAASVSDARAGQGMRM